MSKEKIVGWLKCMEKGSPCNTAKLNKEGQFVICFSGQVTNIHPESLAFYVKPRPSFVLFYQVVKTNKMYLRDVTVLGTINS